MEFIKYEDIKAGDKILAVYGKDFSSGVALRKERLYEDDPEAPETYWVMDGMEYLGTHLCSWATAGIDFRLEEHEALPVSPRDAWAREVVAKAKEKK